MMISPSIYNTQDDVVDAWKLAVVDAWMDLAIDYKSDANDAHYSCACSLRCNGLELCSRRISCFHAFWCSPGQS